MREAMYKLNIRDRCEQRYSLEIRNIQ